MTRYTCLISDGADLQGGYCYPVGNVLQQFLPQDIDAGSTAYAKSIGAGAFVNTPQWDLAYGSSLPWYAPGKIAKTTSKAFLNGVALPACEANKAAVTLLRSFMPCAKVVIYHDTLPGEAHPGVAHGADPLATAKDNARLVAMGINGGADGVIVSAYLDGGWIGITPAKAKKFVAAKIQLAAPFGRLIVALRPRYNGTTTPVPLDVWAAMVEAVDEADLDLLTWDDGVNAKRLKAMKAYTN